MEENGKNIYEIEKQVEENGNYKIKVETVSGRTNSKVQKVSDLSENMEIYTAEDLVKFRDRVNKGATYEEKTITLMNDIDLRSVCSKEKSWKPIGYYKGEEESHPFKGTFNGNKKTVDYLYTNTNDDYQGLFGFIENATINETIIGSNSEITGGDLTGGVVGCTSKSTIKNCGNNAVISSTGNCVGGIIGEMDNSNIEGCYNKSNITTGDNYNTAGGIVGYIWINQNGEYYLKNCYNEGDITAGSFVGGIMGSIDTDDNAYILGTVSNCYNKGIIKGTNKGRVGGITPRSSGNVLLEYCYNLGSINNTSSGASGNVGGIVGINRLPDNVISNIKSTVNYCYNVADVISITSIYNIGGLIGNNHPNCYVKNSCQLRTAQVKNNTIIASNRIGNYENDSYTGRLIGRNNGENNIEEVWQAYEENIPTVYDLMNSFSEDESKYWSNSNVNAPKLLWEN